MVQALARAGYGARTYSEFCLAAPQPGLVFGIGQATPARAEALNAESREQKRRLEAAEAKLAESQLSGVFDNAQQVGGIRCV